MPSLRDTQHLMRRWLLEDGDSRLVPQILDAGISPRDRLNIYRNTIIGTMSKALRLSFPAVERLVGQDFFEETARVFVRDHPPRCADLSRYGETFPDFLQRFEPAATLAYLPDVARLEWAVNRGLHAAEATPFEMAELQAIDPCDRDRVRFVAHPSIALLHFGSPVDAIWRAVLERDEAAMAAIDLAGGPAYLLVERVADRIEVSRLAAGAWHFAKALFEGTALVDALARASDIDAPALIAGHLTAGRCVAFDVTPAGASP